MFKIYKRTIHIGTTEQPGRIEYRVKKNAGSKISNLLAIPTIIAGALAGVLLFSVFFVVLLIPLSIFGYRAWRLMKTTQQQAVHQTEGESISAEYTVISEKDKP